jgi:hypothetical protein
MKPTKGEIKRFDFTCLLLSFQMKYYEALNGTTNKNPQHIKAKHKKKGKQVERRYEKNNLFISTLK